jgi:hypothetical protein
MLHAALNTDDAVARIALVPNAVKLLGHKPELHDKVA